MNIKKPTIIIDKELTIQKIKKMQFKAQSIGARFRPHFKTHHSADIGGWFKDLGISSIAVSSVDMARYFADNGWKDIMICIPVNILQSEEINELAKNVSLHLIFDSLEAIERIGNTISNTIFAWIEIDVGYKRTGISSENIDVILKGAHAIQIQENMILKGIITHAGHTYHATSIEEIKKIHEESLVKMKNIKRILNQEGFSEIEISTGDTPSCSILENFEKEISEIRPGNFVFYDLAQQNIGSCSEKEISISIACPIISKHSERNEIIIYGGGTSLAKEYYLSDEGERIYGLICLPEKNGHRTSPVENVYLCSLTQEHGKVIGPSEFINNLEIGDILHILPVHACQASILHGYYQLQDGTILNKYRP